MPKISEFSEGFRFVIYMLILLALPLIIAIWGYRCYDYYPYRHKPWIIAVLGEIGAFWYYDLFISSSNSSESKFWISVVLLTATTIINGITFYKNIKALEGCELY